MPDLILSAWRGHEQFVTWLVKELKPKTVVELGVDRGFSAFVFARAGAGRVYGIDSFEGDPEAGHRDTYTSVLEKQKELGIDNLELIRGYFADIAKDWTEPIDILHIDGRHRYEDVKEDFEIWSAFVRPGGVILLHDTTEFEEPYGVHRFFAEISLPKTNFTHSHGLGVVSTDQAIIDRINQVCKVPFVAHPLGYTIQRIGRKIRKTLLRGGPPEF